MDPRKMSVALRRLQTESDLTVRAGTATGGFRLRDAGSDSLQGLIHSDNSEAYEAR